MAYFRAQKNSKMAMARHQTGVGMIEVLISLLISAVALLGMAGLQVQTMRFQKVSHFRATAIQYAGEMADRVRANLAGAKGGAYGSAEGQYGGGPGAMPSCASPLSCTNDEVAKIDLYNWRLNLSQGLTGGWGEISGDITDGFVVRVYFREPNKSDLGLDPNCRAGALNAGTDADVRCFISVFLP